MKRGMPPLSSKWAPPGGMDWLLSVGAGPVILALVKDGDLVTSAAESVGAGSDLEHRKQLVIDTVERLAGTILEWHGFALALQEQLGIEVRLDQQIGSEDHPGAAMALLLGRKVS
jgi:hypothetical protein